MTVSHSYKVHGVSEEKVAVKASLNGREVDATVAGLVVELVSDKHGHTFRFTPETDAEMAEARALFQKRATVMATFTQSEASPPAEEEASDDTALTAQSDPAIQPVRNAP